MSTRRTYTRKNNNTRRNNTTRRLRSRPQRPTIRQVCDDLLNNIQFRSALSSDDFFNIFDNNRLLLRQGALRSGIINIPIPQKLRDVNIKDIHIHVYNGGSGIRLIFGEHRDMIEFKYDINNRVNEFIIIRRGGQRAIRRMPIDLSLQQLLDRIYAVADTSNLSISNILDLTSQEISDLIHSMIGVITTIESIRIDRHRRSGRKSKKNKTKKKKNTKKKKRRRTRNKK